MVECVGFAGAAGAAASKRSGRLAGHDDMGSDAGDDMDQSGWDTIFDNGDADGHHDEMDTVASRVESDAVLASIDELGECADDDFEAELGTSDDSDEAVRAVAGRRAALREARRFKLSTDPHPLDALRIHPRHYGLCVQMAVSADQLAAEDAREHGHPYTSLVSGDASEISALDPNKCRDVLRGTIQRAQLPLRDWARRAAESPGDAEGNRLAVGWRIRQRSSCLPHEAWSPSEALLRSEWTEEVGRSGAEGVCQAEIALHFGSGLGFAAVEADAGSSDPLAVWVVAEPRDALEEMDLPAFAEELEHKGRMQFLRLLERYKAELRRPYGSSRDPYSPPSNAAVFGWLTGETSASLRPGVLGAGVVMSARRSGLSLRFHGSIRAECTVDELPDSVAEAAREGQDIQAMIPRDSSVHVRVVGIDRVMRKIMVSARREIVRLPPPLPICDRYVDTASAMEAVRKQLLAR